MDLTIKIEDPALEQAILSGVKDLDQDQLAEVIKGALASYLERDSNMEKLVYRKKQYFDSPSIPTDWFVNIFKNYDCQEVKDLQSLIVGYVRDNYKDLVMNALVLALSKQLINSDFSSALTCAFGEIAGTLRNVNVENSIDKYEFISRG